MMFLKMLLKTRKWLDPLYQHYYRAAAATAAAAAAAAAHWQLFDGENDVGVTPVEIAALAVASDESFDF